MGSDTVRFIPAMMIVLVCRAIAMATSSLMITAAESSMNSVRDRSKKENWCPLMSGRGIRLHSRADATVTLSGNTTCQVRARKRSSDSRDTSPPQTVLSSSGTEMRAEVSWPSKCLEPVRKATTSPINQSGRHKVYE